MSDEKWGENANSESVLTRGSNDHSIPILMSYNLGEFLGQILGRTIGTIYLFFYETELLLSGGYILIANIIFSIWNAINDPILGYLCGKPTRWTKKWGKYFPWIVISCIPMILFYVLVMFASKSWPQLAIFAWMLIILCLTDTFASIFSVNTFGLYPTKFVSPRDRRRSGQVNVLIGTLGTVLAFILPPLLYHKGNISSYRIMAGVIGGFSVIIWLLLIPGVKPDKPSLQLEQQPGGKDSFLSILKTAFKQKNYIIYIIASFCYYIWVSLTTNSLPYYVNYILKMELSAQTTIWIFYLGGTLVSLPLWNKIAKKYGLVRLFGGGLLLMGICTLPLAMIRNIYGIYAGFFAMGFALGGFWAAFLPVFGIVMDEVYFDTQKQQTGVYLGIKTFFSRFEIIFKTVIIVGIHELTNFNPNPGVIEQTSAAKFGLILHTALIPAVIAIFGAIFFLMKFKISADKEQRIHDFIQQTQSTS